MFVLALLAGTALAKDKKSYSQEVLDQMMAPIALYPDSLLSQILMASTYPDQVKEAVKWTGAHPDEEGDAAVKAVQDKPWDPSVMSLVAFPQVLDMMGKQPDWVEDLGNAFLAQPDEVMDTAQSLRKKAQDAGNLETTKEQTVTTDTDSGTQTIVIQQTDPNTVYVPVYNPTVVYGTWWYPAFPPYYYYPPGYSFSAGLASGIGFGIGIAITNSLWGGVNWGHHDIDIDVNKHNNINVNRNRLDVDKNTATWNRNDVSLDGARSSGSEGTPGSVEQRQDYRGRDAEREQARASMEQRGIDPDSARRNLQGSGGDQARQAINQHQGPDSGSLTNRAGTGNNYSSGWSGSTDHALTGVRNSDRSMQSMNRGMSSNRSMQGMSRGGHRGGGGRRR